MKEASSKFALWIIFFILASSISFWLAGVQFRRLVMVEAQVQETYDNNKCKTDADCENKCDAGVCERNCLELPSRCFNGQCACPFGPEHSATKAFPNSTCTIDDNCSKLCPSDCNIRSCLEAKCHCGCHG
ncbi:hypothetical protein P8452_40876 [Trifolium repens]|nr:hypothetical protein P8452_40876 [Trifolium repens]